MLRGYGEAATPCPSGWKRGTRSSFNSSSKDITDFDDKFDLYDDDTAAIDFTTDFCVPLTRVKPRKPGKTAEAFDIHEDGLDKLGAVAGADKRAQPGVRARIKPIGKNSMLSQPAQRFQRPRVSFAAAESPKVDPKAPQKTLSQRQDSPAINKVVARVKEQQHAASPDPLKKATRRDTIYIPPEDTTVPSVFMGIFSPVKSLNVPEYKSKNPEDSEIGNLESKIAQKRPSRKSFAVAPRRAPLQPSLKSAQESSIKQDIPGQNGGKENIPPGELDNTNIKVEEAKRADFPVFDVPLMKKRKTVAVTEPLKRTPPTVKPATKTRPEAGEKPPPANRKILGNKPNSAVNAKQGLRENNPSHPKASTKARQSQSSRVPGSPSAPKPRVTKKPSVQRKPTSKLTVPRIPSIMIVQKYPLLSEDISNPAMYEENWLAHQEVVITQLVNGLFDSAQGSPDLYDSDALRHELLKVYQETSFSLLHKRVHASLLYGALSVPRDILARGSRMKDDIGRKRAFLNLWMDTYELSALRAAAETVVGRRLSVPNTPSRPSDATTSTRQKEERQYRRALETFLETFILRNEDVGAAATSPNSEDVGTPSWSYRRTLLRSIMIIVLLDRARLNSDTLLPRRLFNPSSKYKSSAAVLQALGIMLLPAVGDITRPLNHLDCQVGYKQNPLQEYDYRINNLAVDLRDGILLTRLVELLLYPSATSLFSQQHDPDATTTLAMPTGEVLSLLQGEDDCVLSQHLRFPCIGRATKLFNVQIALGALSGVRGIGVIAKDIRAEDIVDGYREKTIALLWGLVGKWGLSGLVDWDDVRKEISRLEKKINAQEDSQIEESPDDDEGDEEDFGSGYDRHSYLLKKWASRLAQLKGIRLNNLTTSFADGQIFESIVDEYEWYIVGERRTLSCSASLDARLRSLGCSSQFASLVTPGSSPSSPSPTTNSSHFFDRDFTLAALAFLCCRLLPASKKARAAVVLQSAWRRTYARRQLQKRLVAKKVAAECRAVAQEREQLSWATGVIIRWWRGVRGKRAEKKCPSLRGPEGAKKSQARKSTTITQSRKRGVLTGVKVSFAEDVNLADGQRGQVLESDDQPIESDLWLDL
ncbi:hypothetical protein AJ79_03197 [Helicocarpus griseus UAMH5409]|uniref:Calponin-homology (CH) domain-containing protein n=1 Tax=Helicocarpus griseus UAMH5409 TaxID=1447875 RepID=A0A2B7XR28_9EURO|nr:hypothetical protein AJ79_03197 [Helicocarpus griseus UAMH5409]